MTSTDLFQATRKLTKASDCREDTALLSQAHANWEEYLTPAPLSIAFLGELVFISSNEDFSIREGKPEAGFKHIQYPDSFRACLMQVCNSGWRAFNEAHKSMDRIHMYTRSVPDYISNAVKILLQDDYALIQNYLPDTLESISSISKNCVTLAEKVERKFDDVTELISELLEVCTSAKQHYGVHLKDVREKLKVEKLKKQVLEKEHKLANAQFEKVKEQTEASQKRLEQAIDSLPSGWNVIAMDFVEGLSNTFTNLIGGIIKATIGGNDGELGQNSKSAYATNEILCKSSLFMKAIEVLCNLIQGDKIDWASVHDTKTGKSSCDIWKKLIEDELPCIKDVDDCSAKDQAMKLCRDIVEICSDLTAMGTCVSSDPSAKPPKEACSEKNLIQRLKTLTREVQKFDSVAKKETKTSPFPVSPPESSKARTSMSGTPVKASSVAVQNAHLRIEQTRAQLQDSMQMYDKSLEKMEQRNRDLAKKLALMRRSSVREINFEDTIRVLAQDLQVMGELQENWRKMVKFFQMVSVMVDGCSKSLDRFVVTAQTSTQDLTYPKMFEKDMIYQQAFQASNIANLVNMISGTYTEISSKYLMDRVGSLGKLMTLDPKDPTFLLERKTFRAGCDEAAESIRSLVLDNKERYKKRTKARLEKIHKELRSALPPPSKEEQITLQSIAGAPNDDFEEELDQYA